MGDSGVGECGIRPSERTPYKECFRKRNMAVDLNHFSTSKIIIVTILINVFFTFQTSLA